MLFACDELSGFLVACALVQPTKSIRDVKIKSVIKRLKSKRFAAGVDRDDVHQGAAALGVELQEHIATLLEAFSARAEELGLGGIPAAAPDQTSEESGS